MSKTREERTKHKAVLNFIVTFPATKALSRSLCVNQPMSTAIPIVSVTMAASKDIIDGFFSRAIDYYTKLPIFFFCDCRTITNSCRRNTNIEVM